MPWERRWVPQTPPHGAPPWLPLTPDGGFWTDVYVKTPEELEAERQRDAERNRAFAAAEAARAQAHARIAAEIAELVEASEFGSARGPWTLDDDDSCGAAWRALVDAHVFSVTHDLVYWKARGREWEAYFRWLPDQVVRQSRRHARGPLWRVGNSRWADHDGRIYLVADDVEDADDGRLADRGSGSVVLPRGQRFRTEHRRPPEGGRAVYYVKGGFDVVFRDRLDARDLEYVLSHYQ